MGRTLNIKVTITPTPRRDDSLLYSILLWAMLYILWEAAIKPLLLSLYYRGRRLVARLMFRRYWIDSDPGLYKKIPRAGKRGEI
jgi:hypothetical protein